MKPQLLLLLVALFLINFVQLPGTVQAATLSVNVTGVATDTADGDGNCSLIDAIQEANLPGTESADCGLGDAGADTIVLPGNITLNGSSLFNGSGNNGLPLIASNITIDGGGFTISRSDATCPGVTDYRFFNVIAGSKLTLVETTLRNGCMQGNNGGAILNAGTLVLINSALENNTTSGMGGAIYNSGTTSLLNSTITNNKGDSGGGGIASTGTLDIANSTINNNNTLATNTADGGGIFNSGGTLNIDSSVIRFNSTNDDGGGIYDINGTVNILSSAISDNSAFARDNSDGGGGLHSNSGNVEIANSVFDNNYSRMRGGAVYLREDAVMNIYNSQLTNNIAYQLDGGASYNTARSKLNIYYTTISGNEAGDDGGGLRTTDSDVLIEKSLIMNNVAANSGGGIRNDGRLIITDSTVYGNQAGVYGGGVFNQGNPNASNRWSWNITTIKNTTITQNVTAGGGGGVANRYAGGELNISNSIVSGNSSSWGSPNCLQEVRTDSNGTGVWNTIGVGYEDNFSLKCPNFTWTRATNMGPLANNGGATQTVSINGSSIALNSSGADATTADQRDVAAVSTRDAGAFEYDAILPILSFVTANSTGEEGNAHTVNVVLDNTSGNLSNQSITFYLKVVGTAVGSNIDYNNTTTIPITFSGGNWPAPGTTSTLPINLDLILDNEVDPGETVVLQMAQSGIAGPAFIGSTDTHTVTINEQTKQIDLSLTKTVATAPGGDVDGDGILEPGDTVRYSITLANLGPDDATDITIEDALPAGLDGATASVTASIGTYNLTNGEWSADGAGAGNGFDLNAGNNATLTIDAVISAGTSGSLITNTVSVSTTHPPTESDIDTSNNTADASFTVDSTSADLSISNQIDFAPGGDLDGDGVFDPGETVRYTVTLTNQGTHDTDDVVIDVVLSTLLDATTINATASVGTYNPATGEWSADGVGAGNGFAITSGATETLAIDVAILPNTHGEIVTNAAGVSTTFLPTEPDPDLTNNAMSNQFTIASSTRAQSKSSRPDDDDVLVANNPQIEIFDPAISKLGILLPGQVGLKGEKLEWIVTVRNTGSATGTNVDVVDTLIPALRIDNVVINSGTATASVNGQTVTVNIPSLPPGGVVQFSIFTTVLDSNAVVENTACVTGGNGPVCVSATAVSTLPLTGETPLWRTLLVNLVMIIGIAFMGLIGGFTLKRIA